MQDRIIFINVKVKSVIKSSPQMFVMKHAKYDED